MKTASLALIQFLEDVTTYVYVDCYAFTLSDGVTVLRWSGTNMPAVVNGNTYNLGPPIQDEGVQSQRGMSNASVDITILGGDGRFTVNGEDVLDFIENFGLDGATCRIDRAFSDSWANFYTNGPVGSFCRFIGNVGEIKEHGQTQSVVTIDSFAAVLQTSFPAEDYGTSCNNVFGDAKCGVNVPSLAKTSSVDGSDPTQPLSRFLTLLTDANFYWNLGVITFTSGANKGQARTVKQFLNGYGVIETTSPFPSIPQNGDQFTITPGCLLSVAACQSWDTPPSGQAPALPYKQRFRATPYVPPPSTGLPT